MIQQSTNPSRGRPSRPYVGRHHEPPPRATLAQPRDHRVPEVPVRALTLEEIRALLRPGALDLRLRGVDATFERWAWTHGTGQDLPGIAACELAPRCTVASRQPLADADMLVIDRVVRVSPISLRTLVRWWYRTHATVEEICKVLKIKRRQSFSEEKQKALFYYRGKLEGLGIELPGVVD